MADCGPSPRRTAASGVTLEVELVRHDAAWAAAGVTDALLKRAALAASGLAPSLRHGTYHLTLALTNDAEMRRLNLTWRGWDAPTNVLSFPADEDISEPGFLGDVVLAYETTEREAREQDIALQDHAAHLVVHGVLHLIGFDHADRAEAERMEDIERRALASLGIADPYAETKARPAEVPS